MGATFEIVKDTTPSGSERFFLDLLVKNLLYWPEHKAILGLKKTGAVLYSKTGQLRGHNIRYSFWMERIPLCSTGGVALRVVL